MKKICGFFFLVLLTSCSFAPRETGSGFLFALEPVSIEGKAAPQGTLVVAMPTATAELDTHRIALKRGGRQWDYYAGARWSNFLPAVAQDNLAKTLQQSHLFRDVVTDESGLSGDRILKTDIQSFQAEYAPGAQAPVIKIRMVFSFVTRLERQPLASFAVEAQKKAAGNTLSAVQAAFADAFAAAQRQFVKKLKETSL